MIWGGILYTILLSLTASILIITALYIWWSSQVPGAKMVTLLILTGTLWILAYARELSTVSMSAKLFLDKVQISAMAVVPTLWIVYTLQFSGLEKWLTHKNVALLSIVPCSTILLIFTNESHNLLWSNIGLISRGSTMVLERTFSTGYWIFLAYSYSLILYGSILLTQMFIRSRHLYRQQTWLLLVTLVLPVLGCIIYIMGTIPLVVFGLPLLPVGVTTLVIVWGLARLRLADIAPVAWESVVLSVSDSVIVLDRNNVVVNLNPAMQTLLDRPASELVGQPIEEVWPGPLSFRETVENFPDREVVITIGGIKHTFDIRISPLVDWRGRTVGQVVVFRDITERKKAEELLHESEEKFRTIFENASDEIVYVDTTGKIIDVNKKSEEILGYRREEIIGKNFAEFGFLGEESVRRMIELFRNVIVNGNPIPVNSVELELRHKNGTKILAEVNTQLIMRNGRVEGILSIVRDVTERKQAEEKTRASLREKEILLQEIHHRVKNNLQVISSLLNLQSKYIHDIQYKEMLRECQNRIKSMAIIHEKLYQSENLAEINFEEYIRSLVQGLLHSYKVNKNKVTVAIDVGDVLLSIDTAIPCGLIVNELVSNSLKHAFPEGRSGEIGIALHSRDNCVELMVSDNGVGIPENFDFKTSETLGLRLVTILAEDQLDGEITLNRTRGTEFCITFELSR